VDFVGILDRFEQRVDRLVNGAFARAFETDVQPVEIAAALQAEVDERAMIVGAGRTVVPNSFTVDLSESDYARLSQFDAPLREELSSALREHISDQRYTTLGKIAVSFNRDSSLGTGIFRVNAAVLDESGAPVEAIEQAVTRRGPHLVVNGFVHNLTRQATIIGRGVDADIRLDDTGVSRHHCQISLAMPPILKDLGSTNGTWVADERITEINLVNDLDFTVGATVIQFRMR
jgi:hypothetical protein